MLARRVRRRVDGDDGMCCDAARRNGGASMGGAVTRGSSGIDTGNGAGAAMTGAGAATGTGTTSGSSTSVSMVDVDMDACMRCGDACGGGMGRRGLCAGARLH